MNREKKEELRKYNAKRKGKTVDEIEEINLQEEIDNVVGFIAGCLHARLFSEEYDFMMDSIADAKDRAKGVSPMSEDYINRIAIKREALEMSALSSSGESTSNDTKQYCRTIVEGAFKESHVQARWLASKMAMDGVNADIINRVVAKRGC